MLWGVWTNHDCLGSQIGRGHRVLGLDKYFEMQDGRMPPWAKALVQRMYLRMSILTMFTFLTVAFDLCP